VPLETVIAAVTAAIAAFTGLNKSFSSFNQRIDDRFRKIEDTCNELEDTVIRDYVLKQDFFREMQSVHQKLDRIWDYMMNHKP